TVFLLLSRLSFHAPPPTQLYTLSLHDALPISRRPAPGPHHPRPAPDGPGVLGRFGARRKRRHPARILLPEVRRRVLAPGRVRLRSEEHTSELQSRRDLVCRLLLEKKKKKT